MQNTNGETIKPEVERLMMGEAWVWCQDCNAKLTEFDGDQDVLVPCPHPKKCKDEKR